MANDLDPFGRLLQAAGFKAIEIQSTRLAQQPQFPAGEYPSLKQAMSPYSPTHLVAMGYDDDLRALVAVSEGLEELVVRDQLMRAICVLKIEDAEVAHNVTEQIIAVIQSFSFRANTTGNTMPPAELRNIIENMADGAKSIAKGLLQLRQARTANRLDDIQRSQELDSLMLSIAEILPQFDSKRSDPAHLRLHVWNSTTRYRRLGLDLPIRSQH